MATLGKKPSMKELSKWDALAGCLQGQEAERRGGVCWGWGVLGGGRGAAGCVVGHGVDR